MGDALTGREEESKYGFLFLFFHFILFIYFLPSGGGSVPFVHPRKYALVSQLYLQKEGLPMGSKNKLIEHRYMSK